MSDVPSSNTAVAEPTKETQAVSREDAAAAAVVAASNDRGRVSDEKIAELKEGLKSHKPAEVGKDRDDKGRFKEAKTEIKADENKPAENKPSKPDDSDVRKAREDSALARHALKRDGFTDEEIDAMPPASLRLVGLKAKERQDALAREHAAKSKPNQTNVRREVEEGEAEGQGRSREADPSALLGAALPEPEADGPQAEGLERVLEKLDDDERTLLKQAIDTDRSKVAKELRELEKTVKQARKEVFETRLSAAQSTLSREYPQLADDARAAEVGKFMKRLEPNRDITSFSAKEIHELLSTACAAVFGREVIQAARDQHAQAISEDIAGQPYMGGSKGSDTPSKVSREDIIAKAVVKHGGNIDAARREVARSLGV